MTAIRPYLGIGGNLVPDGYYNLLSALEVASSRISLSPVIQRSRWYKTACTNFDQPDFLNAVLAVKQLSHQNCWSASPHWGRFWTVLVCVTLPDSERETTYFMAIRLLLRKLYQSRILAYMQGFFLCPLCEIASVFIHRFWLSPGPDCIPFTNA